MEELSNASSTENEPIVHASQTPNQMIDVNARDAFLGDYGNLVSMIETQPALLLFTFRGDLSSVCNKQLTMINSFVDEFIELGYRVVGITSQSPKQLEKLKTHYLLKFDIFSTPDDGIISYLHKVYQIKVNVTPSLSYDSGIMFEPAFIVLNEPHVLYSWTFAPNYMSRSMNLRPKVIRIMDIIKGISYQQDNPTPTNAPEFVFNCKNNRPGSGTPTETNSSNSDVEQNPSGNMFNMIDLKFPSCTFNAFKCFFNPVSRLPQE